MSKLLKHAQNNHPKEITKTLIVLIKALKLYKKFCGYHKIQSRFINQDAGINEEAHEKKQKCQPLDLENC